MKILGLIVAMALLFSGCATFNHSESIETDQLQGYASGRYNSSSAGTTGSYAIAGTGGGWGTGGGGFGAGAISINSGPPQVTPYYFARSVAMINYSKKLKSIKYDEAGGIIDYEFEHQPQPQRTSSQPAGGQSRLPSSFGHQPIE